MNLQDAFLNQIRLTKAPVTIYLIGGQQLKGLIRGFDSFAVILEMNGRDNLIYKHAISTIVPQNPLTIFKNPEKEKQDQEHGQID